MVAFYKDKSVRICMNQYSQINQLIQIPQKQKGDKSGDLANNNQNIC